MAYPLENWKNIKRGYLFGQTTFYTPKHLGTDYIISTGTRVIAPFDGIARTGQGPEGGNRIELECTVSGQKYVIRFLHLSKFIKSGAVKAGDVIAYSGNTGLSTAPHCHIDISKNAVDLNNFGNFVDPEKFNWLSENTMNPMDTKIKDIPEVEFNKLHDICNAQYPGWTQEMYNKNGRNAFQEYLGVPNLVTMRDLWNYMENKPAFVEMRKNLQQGSAMDKSAIKDHANQIIKLVS